MKISDWKFVIILTIIPLIVIIGYCSLGTPKYFSAPKPECVNGIDNKFIKVEDYLDEGYQHKVIELLKTKNPEDYRYIFKIFIDDGRRTYMYIDFIGPTGCFTAKMLVDKWDKLDGMKTTNGVSYPSELYNLKWAITEIDGSEKLVYIDMNHIID